MRKHIRQKGTIGSTLDEFLKEEGTYESTQAVAIKRVLAWRQVRYKIGGYAKHLDI